MSQQASRTFHKFYPNTSKAEKDWQQDQLTVDYIMDYDG